MDSVYSVFSLTVPLISVLSTTILHYATDAYGYYDAKHDESSLYVPRVDWSIQKWAPLYFL